MRYFEDLTVGQISISKPMHVERAKLLAFANEYDPQYFHADEAKDGESSITKLTVTLISSAASAGMKCAGRYRCAPMMKFEHTRRFSNCVTLANPNAAMPYFSTKYLTKMMRSS